MWIQPSWNPNTRAITWNRRAPRSKTDRESHFYFGTSTEASVELKEIITHEEVGKMNRVFLPGVDKS